MEKNRILLLHLHSIKFTTLANSKPVKLIDLIKEIERNLGKRDIIEFMPRQTGDVSKTCANVDGLGKDFNYKLVCSVEKGIKQFI